MKKALKSHLILTLFIALAISAQSIKAQHTTLITADEIKALYESNSDTLFVVNFWATWCKPCVREMPYFKEVQAQTSDQPVRFIFVSLNTDAKQLQPFFEKTGYTRDMYLLKDTNPNDFIPKISTDWQGAIPATLFIYPIQNIYSFHEQEFTKEALLTTIKKYLP